jgi:hypothetical protein
MTKDNSVEESLKLQRERYNRRIQVTATELDRTVLGILSKLSKETGTGISADEVYYFGREIGLFHFRGMGGLTNQDRIENSLKRLSKKKSVSSIVSSSKGTKPIYFVQGRK